MAETKNVSKGYSTDDGQLKFGHINEDGVISAALLRSGHHPFHFISLDSDAGGAEKHRKNGTICKSPGSFQVQAGDTVPNEQPAIFFDAVNGDIVLRASNGRIRIEAKNIDIIASGGDGKNGVVTVDADEKVIIKSQTIDVSGTVSTKIFSEKTVEVIGNGILNIYGGLIESMDGATSGKTSKGSKTCPVPTLATPTEIRQKILSFIETIS